MPEITQELDRLLDALTRPASDGTPDAIDRTLAAPPRRTEVHDLTGHPVVARFREDLANGLVRVETANALFQLLTRALTARLGL